MLLSPEGAESRAQQGGLTAGPQAARLVYLMLFRVGLVTLMLGALFVTELVLPGSTSMNTGPAQRALFVTVISAYGLTLVYALLFRRIERVDLFATVQIAIDLCGVSVLVLYTGAPDSTFGFTYLLVIVGASTVLSLRGFVIATAGAVLLYLGVSLLGFSGFLILDDALAPSMRMPLQHFLRPLALNGVAMLATAALATRLAIELKRAAERIDSQRTSLCDLATLYREVIQSLRSGLISVDLQGLIATVNTAAGEILGILSEQAIGKPVGELLPGIDKHLILADLGSIPPRMELCIRAGQDPGTTMTGQAAGPDRGDRILGITVSRLVNHTGVLVGRLINFQDLTDLRRAEESAKQADRLAVIGRMAATVAHEIRNPLAAICGSIELLAQMLPAGTTVESQDLMQIVVREGKRLDELITELLSYATPRPLERTCIDLSQELVEMVQVFENDRRVVSGQVQVQVDGTVYVEVDIYRLRQVMWNLLRNAAEANPGGTIEARVVANREKRQALLVLRDHGPGIAEEARLHLFEPFFTTKETGTGLGLATVHRIIEEHGGHVDIRNVEGGKGAEAVVTLPLSQEPPAEQLP